MSDYPSQTQDKFVLRLPDGMRDRIKEAAAENNRSMNAEIVARLEQSFSGTGKLSEILGAGVSENDLLVDAIRVWAEERRKKSED